LAINSQVPDRLPGDKVFASLGHAFFITFSCYHRRRLLDDNAAKGIVVNVMSSQLKKREGKCVGFAIMPDHVHAVAWFSTSNALSEFVKQWKRLSSYLIRKNMENNQSRYLQAIGDNEPVWQRKFYNFNLYSESKLREKLDYMHNNPARAGLVAKAEQWQFSSARHYLLGQPVGVEIGMPG